MADVILIAYYFNKTIAATPTKEPTTIPTATKALTNIKIIKGEFNQ